MSVSELDTSTLRLTRIFDAPRERVFDAWVKRDHFIQWMCPPGVTITLMEIDVRVGGAWRVEGRNESGRVFSSSGKYVEIKRPERLVFTWAHHADGDYTKPRGHETTVRIELRALSSKTGGNKTELTLIHGAFVDGYDQHKQGWEGSFDKLVTFLGRTA
ncbi:MAG TPA: SRPBCC domain-containing protein [Reyranella sp.]|nr:SRPBCC domain-containing protein [Reyranella sp.]